MTEKLVILYDGECSLCQKAKAWLAEIDVDHALELTPLQDPAIEARFPQLERWAIRAQLHSITPNGQVWVGAQALAAVGRVISTQTFRGKLLRLYAHSMGIPGFSAVAQWVYLQIAKRRQGRYLPPGIQGVR